MNFVDITVELFIGFLLLFLMTKILGKTSINQVTPFEFISALVLGELVGNAIYDEDIGFGYILFAVFVWGLLMYIAEMLELKFLKLRGFLEGNPSIVIRNGIVDRNELKKNKMSINQLQTLLRQKDVFSVHEVEYALLEANGTLSVLKKSLYATTTQQDLDMHPRPSYLPVTFIIDGEPLIDNLKATGFDENWLQDELKKINQNSVKEIFFAEWQQDEGLHVVPMKEATAFKES
ncbi:DUF421 domain-containing protein [Chengkuizengella axinellae]|uniref:DUF421 domain-containing protein n=1 Tax=Chengkuizengella axinellae TaxID=3064388 RepID=A0ABT9J0Z9_9BACL|nr:DUF421 domain-containing protein [Chengkuizengella sp. 2205SS18-9]MDP5274695.1 DUF421 domain-containing protein [Chengkuizengella sp. 2205SS18-9]